MTWAVGLCGVGFSKVELMRTVLPWIVGTSLSDVAQLDTMVTVVDAGSMLQVGVVLGCGTRA